MRKISFEVPPQVIGDFAQKLSELELDNSIVGKTDEDEIEIEVYYEKNENDQVDELEEYLQNLIDNIEEEDED